MVLPDRILHLINIFVIIVYMFCFAGERNQKYKELKKREESMDGEFCSCWFVDSCLAHLLPSFVWLLE